MTYTAALARLQTLTIAGVAKYGAVDVPPTEADLPALVIDHATQPFAESFTAFDIALTVGRFGVFVDHKLLVSGAEAGTFKERYTAINTLIDAYLDAIKDDMTLNNNLTKPLKIIIINRSIIRFRDESFSGIQFRHFWEIKYA